MNHSIFEQQGTALNLKAKKACKVLVVANPVHDFLFRQIIIV
jgi:malate/lactate dehydrogenase